MTSNELTHFLTLKTPNVQAALESVFEEHFGGNPETQLRDLVVKVGEVYSLTPPNLREPISPLFYRWELELITPNQQTTKH